MMVYVHQQAQQNLHVHVQEITQHHSVVVLHHQLHHVYMAHAILVPINVYVIHDIRVLIVTHKYVQVVIIVMAIVKNQLI